MHEVALTDGVEDVSALEVVDHLNRHLPCLFKSLVVEELHGLQVEAQLFRFL